ncbi:MAG TPA: hypothetical protein VFQ72_02780 [Candidatus Paceibacterota bacterium]|nr:hypothetical protein [Candidatus Paceibacterota bacterium]
MKTIRFPFLATSQSVLEEAATLLIESGTAVDYQYRFDGTGLNGHIVISGSPMSIAQALDLFRRHHDLHYPLPSGPEATLQPAT